ncbi:MAG: pyridoxamine 5'-phosphate oxidase family protein [Reyranella sp.]|uniref:pyridoxamine 5'-phosphate oxidase family protein n=1 Tax=Reyranella sp. TaxID=1929291 RepID=UPI003D0A4A2D
MKQRKRLILQLLEEHRLMALGTNSPDGWPHVTSVGYVNDGFLLYCFIASNSRKHANILLDDRVSIAICSDAPRPLDIKGLSLTGRASVVRDSGEFERASRLRLMRYPEYAAEPPSEANIGAAARISPRPLSSSVVLLRITPETFSLVDYSKGFGHSDVVTFSERDLDVHVASLAHHWDDHST